MPWFHPFSLVKYVMREKPTSERLEVHWCTLKVNNTYYVKNFDLLLNWKNLGRPLEVPQPMRKFDLRSGNPRFNWNIFGWRIVPLEIQSTVDLCLETLWKIVAKSNFKDCMLLSSFKAIFFSEELKYRSIWKRKSNASHSVVWCFSSVKCVLNWKLTKKDILISSSKAQWS